MQRNIGKYRVIKELGAGGFGAVYLAEDPHLGEPVAIKIFQVKDDNVANQISSSSSDSIEALKQRFLSEARILRRLSTSPNIVDMYDFDELEDGTPYYVMPYLNRSLEHEIGKDAFTSGKLEETPKELYPRKVPLTQGLLWLKQALEALREVHHQGLIHRDIKPANLLFNTKGQLQLCDFGIAKTPDGDHSASGVGMGSRNYMSPEQHESAKHVDTRSDIYSVGVLAYRMLTGTLPVGRYDDPIIYVPAIGDALNQLLLSAMAQQPSERPADAGVMLKQLQEAEKSINNSLEEEESTVTFTEPGKHFGFRDELLPIKHQITELLEENGYIPPEEKGKLGAMAEIVDLDEFGLEALVQQVLTDHTDALKPILNLVKAIDRRLQHGVLNPSQQQLLIEASVGQGFEESKVAQLIRLRQEILVHSESSDSVAADVPEKDFVKPKNVQVNHKAFTIAASAIALALSATVIYLLADNQPVSSVQQKALSESDLQALLPQVGQLASIPAGSFQMGDIEGNGPTTERPAHHVSVDGFYMMAHEVTFAQWDQCVDTGGCEYQPDSEGKRRASAPVINVSYRDIKEQYIPWLNNQTNRVFRLPTEAEWEYAARAGTSTLYYWGNSPSEVHANGNEGFGWKDDGIRYTASVGSFEPNGFGLYDMSGNAAEWVEDCWHANYNNAPLDGSAWLEGSCEQHVVRGGSYLFGPDYLRSSSRKGFASSNRLRHGFRLVLDKG